MSDGCGHTLLAGGSRTKETEPNVNVGRLTMVELLHCFFKVVSHFHCFGPKSQSYPTPLLSHSLSVLRCRWLSLGICRRLSPYLPKHPFIGLHQPNPCLFTRWLPAEQLPSHYFLVDLRDSAESLRATIPGSYKPPPKLLKQLPASSRCCLVFLFCPASPAFPH